LNIQQIANQAVIILYTSFYIYVYEKKITIHNKVNDLTSIVDDTWFFELLDLELNFLKKTNYQIYLLNKLVNQNRNEINEL